MLPITQWKDDCGRGVPYRGYFENCFAEIQGRQKIANPELHPSPGYLIRRRHQEKPGKADNVETGQN